MWWPVVILLQILPLLIQRQLCAFDLFVPVVCENEALVAAVLAGATPRVDALLRAGRVNLAFLGEDGMAALHAACLFGDIEAVGALARLGANLTLQTASGETCVVRAQENSFEFYSLRRLTLATVLPTCAEEYPRTRSPPHRAVDRCRARPHAAPPGASLGRVVTRRPK
jgi:hypothetical protein